VVLSHGHFDHTGGLASVFSGAGHQVPLVVHPDAFLQRRMNGPKGIAELPQLDAIALKKAGADILKRTGPSTLAAGHLLVTGEVVRKTAFETGMPGMEMFVDGAWVPDPIRDDQAIVINVRDKGLVVLSGCAHAGIVNTVDYARKITGVDHVHAVLGGFHLTGPAFAPRIQPTIEGMQRIDPDYVVPMHCTGWDAINRFMGAMPKKCILNTVGTTYVFGGK
jgi:7,8-dihydropterin-6-yl-methyl-4-(beta-D-ribofuranosyl)aminobenzene 5'-phosphate synthase